MNDVCVVTADCRFPRTSDIDAAHFFLFALKECKERFEEEVKDIILDYNQNHLLNSCFPSVREGLQASTPQLLSPRVSSLPPPLAS